jgi:hypothetical protein
MQSIVRERRTRHRADWGAVWGGVFTFAAIWIVFECLALAIFGITHLGVGMAVWTIVLTIIAMYVAGLETARLAGVTTQGDGIAHGLMMFGLAVVSTIIVMFLSNTGLNGANARDLLANGIPSGMAWSAFLSLFLGGLAAMGGASIGSGQKSRTLRPAVPLRPAA